MKNYLKVGIAIIVISIVLFSLNQFIPQAHSYSTGPPIDRTGSPSDIYDCTTCHAGTVVSATGLITSTIPVNGYTPGATYTITATITGAGINMYGFEISPQKINGTKVGTLIITNSAQTQLIGSGKYITHKFAGTSGVGSKTWTFNWTAPLAGTGSFVFYGAFVSANNSGTHIGDLTSLSTLSILENTSVGVSDIVITNNRLIYPNPCFDKLTIDAIVKADELADIIIMDVAGRKVKEINKINLIEKQEINLADLTPGIYLLTLKTEKEWISKKIIKK